MEPDPIVVAPAGDNLTLDCIASGFPIPNVTWTKIENEGSIILSEDEGVQYSDFTTSSITLEDLSIIDAGMYVCSAANTVDNSSLVTKLIVHCEQ